MVIEISVAVIAVAFVILVIYLILLINSLRVTLSQVNKTVEDVRSQLDEMGIQAKKTVEHTNQISFDIKRKMESIHSIFNAISNVGEVLEEKAANLKKESLDFSHKENHLSDSDSNATQREFRIHEEGKVADILELIGVGLRLFQKIRNKHFPSSKN